jgi:RNA polymerase sigma factor (sigma-70 family)
MIQSCSVFMTISFLQSFLGSRIRLARMIGRVVKPDDVEDILQETFISAYAASKKLNIENQQAFMVRVARNLALDHVKRMDKKVTSSLEEIEDDYLLGHGNPESSHQINEQFMALCEAVGQLPVSCRRVFILKKVYGLSLEEIANELNISTSTVEKHVGKGLALVTEQMRSRESGGIANKKDQSQGKRT